MRPTPTSRRSYPGQPIPPGATEYALAFAIPLDTPGLKFLCRDSVASPGADPFDKPLSSRFDEQDAFCMFDDVLVPWDRIFIDGDVEIYNSMRQTGYAISMTTQSTIRALTKLEFAYGLATRMAELIGDHSPATTEMLGEMAYYVRMTANAVELSLEQAAAREDGVWFPNGAALEPMRSMLPVWMPRVAEIITLIGSHNLLTTPSRAQLDDPRLRPLIDEMLSGADGAACRRARSRLPHGLGFRRLRSRRTRLPLRALLSDLGRAQQADAAYALLRSHPLPGPARRHAVAGQRPAPRLTKHSVIPTGHGRSACQSGDSPGGVR